jgi:hypothetical protein
MADTLPVRLPDWKGICEIKGGLPPGHPLEVGAFKFLSELFATLML